MDEITDEYVDQVYEELRAELEPLLSDFDFDVARVYDAGETDHALLFGILAAAEESVPVSSRLIERLRPILNLGEHRVTFEYAVGKIAADTGSTERSVRLANPGSRW